MGENPRILTATGFPITWIARRMIQAGLPAVAEVAATTEADAVTKVDTFLSV